VKAENKPRKSLPRRIWRAGIVAVLLVAALLVAAPYLLSTSFFSGWVLHRIFADVHGTVSAERLDLGWLSPPRIAGLQIRSLDGEPVVSIASIAAEQPLWQLASHPAEIGHVTVDAPHAYLVVTEQGTNFAATFPHDPNRRVPARWRQEAMRVGVEQGAFTWQLAGSEHRWSLGGLQLGVELLPAWLADAHEARLVIEPATVVNHAQLSTGMCEDVLKFIAPVFSNATTTSGSGSFSLALAGGGIPVDRLRDAQFQGVLTLHAVNIVPGEWLAKLAKFIKLPGELNIARESAVKFEVADQRVHHSGLEFGFEELHVRTSGWVGFDESLDLLAEVQLHLSDSTAARLPVLGALNNRVLQLPIKGTLKHPEVDWGGRAEVASGLLAAFEGTLGPEAAARLPAQLQASGILTNPAAVSSAAAELGIAAGELFKGLAERRRERMQEKADARQQAGQPPQPDSDLDKAPGAAGADAPPPAAAGAAAKRGVLGQVLRALVEAAAQATASPDEAPGAAPAAASPPAPAVVPPPSNPAPVTPPPAAEPAGPRLSQPANRIQPLRAAAPAASSDSLPPAANTPAANTPAASAPAASTPAASTPAAISPIAPAPPVPAAVPPVSGSTVPPPPLLSTPLPAAPFQPPPTNPAAKTPPADEPPRRPLGRALRGLLQAAAEAAQASGPQPVGPVPPAGSQNPPFAQAPSVPPAGMAQPASADVPRRPVLRRLFRAAIEAAAEAASQPPAAQSPPAAPQPQPAAQPPAENLPLPAPVPAPAPAPE
jgi:hypothetical protein